MYEKAESELQLAADQGSHAGDRLCGRSRTDASAGAQPQPQFLEHRVDPGPPLPESQAVAAGTWSSAGGRVMNLIDLLILL